MQARAGERVITGELQMAFIENAYVKRGLIMACAGALALGFGAVAAPDEAAAQCALEVDGSDVVDVDGLNAALGGTGTDLVGVNCDDSIDTDQLVDDSVTQDKIADDAVGADQLADDSVDTAAIQDDAVTQAKIADDAVGSAQIQENAVTASELADDSVDTAAIQDGAVTWDKLSSGVQNRIDENTEGVAIALALQNPDLVGRESFGLSVNWGGFDGASAIGIAATGVLGRDVFGAGDRLAIAGGVGFGLDEDTVGGRVGAQLSW